MLRETSDQRILQPGFGTSELIIEGTRKGFEARVECCEEGVHPDLVDVVKEVVVLGLWLHLVLEQLRQVSPPHVRDGLACQLRHLRVGIKAVASTRMYG